MKTPIILLLLCATLLFSSTQKEALVLQLEKKYCLEGSFGLNYGSQFDTSILRTIKIDNLNSNLKQERFLLESLYHHLKEKKLSAFNELNRKLTVNEVQDTWTTEYTITVFDQNQNPIQQIVKDNNFDAISSLTVKQNWKVEDGIFEIDNTEVIPLLPISDINGNETDFKTELFRIPLDKYKYKSERGTIINNPNNVWIKLSIDFFNFDDLNPNEKFIAELKKIVWDKPKNGETPIYSGNSILFNETLSLDYFQNEILTLSQDTTITFDPRTYQKNIKIFETGAYSFEDMDGLKVYQLWVWNDKKSTLTSIPIGVGPYVEGKKRNTTLYAIKLRYIY